MTELAELRGLGPTSARWLAEAGIETRAELERLGAVGAYRAVRATGRRVSLNLLWALQGALMDIHFTQVPASIKAQLRAELEGDGTT